MKNAADEGQVKEAARKDRDQRKTEINDLRDVLALPCGRNFVWRLLERTGTFRSIWDSSARIHYNAGQQDIGHFLLAEITEANPEALLQMMKKQKEGDIENV